MKMVYVEWVDSATAGGWHDSDHTITPLRCTSVGFIHEKTKRRIVLAGSHDTQGRVLELTTIPRCAITKMRKLR